VITLNGTLEFDKQNNDAAYGTFSSNVAGTPMTNLPSYIRIERPSFTTTEPYRLFAVIQPPLSSATPEAEPNNNLGQANSAPNNYFYGALTNSTDVDSYSFEADAGNLLFISLDTDPLRNQTSFNGALDLLDEFGNVLVSVDNPAGTSQQNQVNTSTNSNEYPFSPGEALVFHAINSGSYFVRVRIGTPAAGVGDYLLSISRNCIPGGAGSPATPNVSSIVQLPNGNLRMTIQGTPGVAYRVAWSPDLATWSTIPGSGRTTSGNGLCDYEFPSTSSQGFYRAVWP
jgi:hypothetical protein